ncbi:hypothetical protein BDU57DRAFT_513957 [Ampelomyces quisqualis]|uniref:Uncharacterized protein n=1 Tax=Ampelomyces quisqualis TaxID=50730 RepID=A0A6A5QQH6_AMPQU|nr:hypothetical protein BDU57DRAFT_513957 [Ampelomyces quisqualis]
MGCEYFFSFQILIDVIMLIAVFTWVAVLAVHLPNPSYGVVFSIAHLARHASTAPLFNRCTTGKAVCFRYESFNAGRD